MEKISSKAAKKRLANHLTAYAFCAPWMIGFVCFTLFPIIFLFAVSLTNRKLNGVSKYIGLANYINMFQSSTFWNSLWVTLFFTIVMMIVTTIWAVVMALLLNYKQKLNGLFQFCYFLPSVIPTVALAYTFRTIFGKEAGLLNGIISAITGKNVMVNWLYDSRTVYVALFFITLFTYNTGQMMLIFRSGLNDVPRELYEACDIDGANPLQKFIKITLPMISPIVLFNAVMGCISALNGSFALLYPLTGENGDPNGMSQVLSLLIYKEAFSNMKVGYACAMSVILFLIACCFGIGIFAISKKIVYYET
ncbi:carbohydrate ABC transporter permease [Lacrimispora xylanolytica]|uniref:Sugar ABC transporter permease n=1 Tax=Lacrimispora xylanolytica TaxID=29375 RepID=A0ABY7AA40_9FIRM|nr:sugar ABC transporter permease [Lacrimispora xylanolytica]WAJ22401.1 sugar ABC transporter permease [Lacrimispora xylanolytica]